MVSAEIKKEFIRTLQPALILQMTIVGLVNGSLRNATNNTTGQDEMHVCWFKRFFNGLFF